MGVFCGLIDSWVACMEDSEKHSSPPDLTLFHMYADESVIVCLLTVFTAWKKHHEGLHSCPWVNKRQMRQLRKCSHYDSFLSRVTGDSDSRLDSNQTLLDFPISETNWSRGSRWQCLASHLTDNRRRINCAKEADIFKYAQITEDNSAFCSAKLK